MSNDATVEKDVSELHEESTRDEIDALYSDCLTIKPVAHETQTLAEMPGETDEQKIANLERSTYHSSYWGGFDTERMCFTQCPSAMHKEALDELLVKLDEQGVDDVILQSDERIFAKLGSHFYPVSARTLTFSEVSELLAKMHRDSTPGKVRSGSPQKYAYSVPYQAVANGSIKHVRFRCKATACQGVGGSQDGIDISMRCIDSFPKTMDELGVPQGIRDLAFPEAGIIIVTGETGSGKTTLLGTIMRFWATIAKGRRIITYNDPIEYDYRAIPNRTGSIAQTEVGEMIPSFEDAIPDAMRRNPCIIELGEVSEQQGIKNVIIAAQTGHRVYTTVHTESVAITFSRMVEVFPQDEQVGKIRSLISTTRGIIHQRLLETKEGGRIPVQEWLKIGPDERHILYNTPAAQLVETLQNLVETRGRSLLADLESKKDLLKDEVYLLTKRELTGDDGEETNGD